MEILFVLSIACLFSYMILATYDGAYLHLWKYELFNRKSSMFEHLTHTIRALLFPTIVWLLFIESSNITFCIGLALVLLDAFILGVDAFCEKASREFMYGLPKWEYVLHLFANSFHFAAILLIIATRIEIGNESLSYSYNFQAHEGFKMVQFVAKNIVSGSIILGIIHLILATKTGRKFWNKIRPKINCCQQLPI